MQDLSSSEVDRRRTRRSESISSTPSTSTQDQVGNTDDEVVNNMRELSVTKKDWEQNMEKLSGPILPTARVPERIVIVVDRALDDGEEKRPFVGNGNQYSSFDMLKRAVAVYVHNKASISNSHQFALMTLKENSVESVLNFQKSPTAVVSALNQVKPCSSKDSLSLDYIFEWINKNTTLFQNPPGDQKIPPPYVVRVLFMFTRSNCSPSLKETSEVNNILNSPNFFFDIVMSNGLSDKNNQCKEYFERLTSVIKTSDSYAYCIGRDYKQLYEVAAKLLSHALQRPNQAAARYDVPQQVNPE